MKKRILFLPAFSLLCLVGCGKSTSTTTIKYRDNVISSETYQNDKKVASISAEYDEKGLPTKQTETQYYYPTEGEPTTEITTRTDSHEFDDENREIKHHATLSSEYQEGEYTTTRVYENDSSFKETTHEEITYKNDLEHVEKTVTDEQLSNKRYDRGGNDGYLITSERYYESITEDLPANLAKTASYSYYLAFSSYDKLKRPTANLSISTHYNKLIEGNNSYTAGPDVTINLNLIDYLSENNDTNYFINLIYASGSSIEGSYLKIQSLGFKGYSDNNDLISTRQVDNVATFVTNDNVNAVTPRAYVAQDYYYDKLGRRVSVEGTQIKTGLYKITVSDLSTVFWSLPYTIIGLVNENDANISSIQTATITYTYKGDSKTPSEMKNKGHTEDFNNEATIDREQVSKYDDYGRLLSSELTSIIKEAESERTTTAKQINTYGEPIRIPEDEELINSTY